MKFYLKLTTLLLVLITFSNCKKGATLSEYKYADKSFDVTCSQINPELLKEAVFSFEDDIANHFATNGTKNISQAYSRIVNLALYSRGKYEEIVSDHTKEIFKLLKNDADLWSTDKNGNTILNYNHTLVKCLSEHIKDKDLKTTFNALISTNSMNSRLFGEPLRRKSNLAVNDKYLATYIALDLYYAKLFNIDLEAPKTEKVKAQPNKIEINKDAK